MPQKTKNTPMMEQYFSIKRQYPDCLLFYRLGDFYELFYDDALIAAQLLEITLTSRNKQAVDPIPMCGVPHHAAKEYIRILIEAGHRVAICEQMEDAKTTKGMVKREVVQVITPGTYIDYAQSDENNYLVAVTKSHHKGYVAYVDLATGELRGTILSHLDELQSLLSTLQTKEILVSEEHLKEELLDMCHYLNIMISSYQANPVFSPNIKLVQDVEDNDLRQNFLMLLDYLDQTQKRTFSHLQPAEVFELDQFLALNFETQRTLELTKTLRSQAKQGTLFGFLDHTKTAMGTRLLKKWIEKPLIVESAINKRHDQVAILIDHFFEREDLKSLLQSIYDLERIVGKVSFGTVNARDLLQLSYSLQKIPFIQQLLHQMPKEIWQELLVDLKELPELSQLLQRAIHEDAPISITEGNIIKEGFHFKLDEYRMAMKHGKQWMAALQHEEREKTGVKSLKISYNKVFGYYIEITKANLHLLHDERYERKQTLANAERFVTSELKEKEKVILEAEEQSMQLEYQLFIEVREMVKSYSYALQKLAQAVATLDVLLAFSTVSEKHQFIRPELSFTDRTLHIVNGRHPVVEHVLGIENFVPNDIKMDPDDQILLITGPNMSGKSTYMRQLALCVIMAQIGCFVPANSAKMPIFTKIFTRIGASDDLIAGQSTFMMEMLETNHALQFADQYSLLLFDEIGRGTATYDGMALAEAIIRYIYEHIPAKVLFSTHYHELTELAQTIESLRNVHVGAVERQGEVVFLHKIMEGPADKSYGIHVAKLAGLPDSLLQNAHHILQSLENSHARVEKSVAFLQEDPSLKSSNSVQSVMNEVKSLNLLTLSPLEVMTLVDKWQKELREG